MSSLRTYTPMRRQSVKVQAEASAFRAVYQAVDERSEGRCEVVLDGERCRKRATEHHHLVKPRRSYHVPELIVHMCRTHHERCEWPYQRGRLCYKGAIIVPLHPAFCFTVRYHNPKWERA
jgi:hypothetical protein